MSHNLKQSNIWGCTILIKKVSQRWGPRGWGCAPRRRFPEDVNIWGCAPRRRFSGFIIYSANELKENYSMGS